MGNYIDVPIPHWDPLKGIKKGPYWGSGLGVPGSPAARTPPTIHPPAAHHKDQQRFRQGLPGACLGLVLGGGWCRPYIPK